MKIIHSVSEDTKTRIVTFFIDTVEEVKWNARAFESLVLPSDNKELILALTESQVQNKETFDDVIQGKGTSGVRIMTMLF